MGFFELLFDSVGYIAGEFGDLCKGVSEDAKQLGDELIHINDDSYVSPYAKKAEAKEMIYKADKRMDRAREKYDEHVKRVEEKIACNERKKWKLLGQIEKNSNCQEAYTSFDYIDIDSIGFEKESDFKIGQFLGIFGHDIMDEAANSYLEDAKDYEIESRYICSKIESYNAKLSRIEDQLEVEERLMNILENQIEEKTKEDKKIIIMRLKKLMSLMICDKNGDMQQKYVHELDMLKKFC